MKVVINTDGGYHKVRGAASSYIINCDGKCVVTSSISEPSLSTNNQAEYQALLRGLKFIADTMDVKSIESIEHICDSKLLVEHFNGTYEVQEPTLIAMMNSVKAYTSLLLQDKFTTSHVKRHFNSDADWLCNLILDKI